jgi:hypothetical protein
MVAEVVDAREEVIEHGDELPGIQAPREFREIHDVAEEYAGVAIIADHLVTLGAILVAASQLGDDAAGQDVLQEFLGLVQGGQEGHAHGQEQRGKGQVLGYGHQGGQLEGDEDPAKVQGHGDSGRPGRKNIINDNLAKTPKLAYLA